MYTDQHYDSVRPSVISVTGGGGVKFPEKVLRNT